MGGEDGFRIAVGVDGSAESRFALEWAVTEARLRHGQVRAVTAWEYPHGVQPGRHSQNNEQAPVKRPLTWAELQGFFDLVDLEVEPTTSTWNRRLSAHAHATGRTFTGPRAGPDAGT